VLVPGLSFAVLAGCYARVPVRVEPPPRDHVVEQCHQTIRGQARDRFGRRTAVSFDTPDTYYISSALEGVRGGGVVKAGNERTRIQYDCTVNIRSGRVVQAQHRPVADIRPVGWSVDACQDRIREEVASDRNRRAVVKFGEVATHDVSLERERVRGRARLKSGNQWEEIRYACTVNVRRGRIEAADYSPVAKPLLSDAEVVKLCQGVIAGEARADRGKKARVSFDTGSSYSISSSERGVHGRAQLRSGSARERIAYECKVDARARRVTLAEYHSLEKPEVSEKRVIDACQEVTREMVAADHGRRAGVKFKTAETFSSSKRKTGVQGRGELRVGGDRDPIHYVCTVDLRKLKITEARYRPIESSRDQSQRTVDLCHEAVRERVASDREGRVSLGFDRSETFFISNSKEGVRGEGGIRSGRRSRDAIRYECEVDIRRGRVTEVRYRYR
jgi:hypothetical protein